MKRALTLLFAFSLVGCQNLPKDDFDAASVLLARGDLLGTLVRLDRVPPADSRYPRARAMAQALERRVRLTQDLIDQGLELRAEWRDGEAVERFEQALEIWPEQNTAARILDATRARMEWLDGEGVSETDPEDNGGNSGAVVRTEPVETDPQPATPGAEPVAETAPPKPDIQAQPTPGPESEVRPEPEPPVASQPQPEQREDRAAREAEIGRKLDQGLLESALTLAESAPTPLPSSKLRDRLVQVLHQRALIHYGHGALDLALNDWSRLLRIDPKHREAREFANAARAELALR